MPDRPLIYAVVLAWNQLAETLECLESLSHSTYPNLRLLLVDNGSSDGTAEQVTEQYPAVEICRLDPNVGIARGYNRGIEVALQRGADYVMVMNNDTVADAEMVSCLLQAFHDRPATGMAMPKIYHFYGDQRRLWYAGARWRSFPPSIKTIGMDQPDGPAFEHYFTVEYAPSCCLLMPRQALEKVGSFDPAYYFYFDDWDLSARFRAAGYEILFVPRAHLWHKVSVSTQKSEKPARWWQAMGKSSVRFYLQHYSRGILFAYTAWFALRETAKLKFNRVPAYLAGVREGLAERPERNL